MNIGDRYQENKIYRGIKLGNHLPMIAEDVLEFSDTVYHKNRYVLESILGSGIIKDLSIYYDAQGIGLLSPAVLNIEGDICLIKESAGIKLAGINEIYSNINRRGTIFVVGWYQHLDYTHTMREYGGVRNNTLPNDLIYEPLQIQVSTRYQFRWDVAISFEETPTEIRIPRRDANGVITTGEYILTGLQEKDSIYKVGKPVGMDYVVDDLYIIPLIKFETSDSSETVTSVDSPDIRRVDASGGFINSTVEPEGKYYEGTTWYNPDTNEFKTYIKDIGFVANSSRIGFIQHQYKNVATQDINNPSDLKYIMTFSDLTEDDILDVTYEGLKLQEGTDYTIDRVNVSINLLNFTRLTGETLVVTMTRIVEASNVTSLTSTIYNHMNKSSNSATTGHVRLSDSTNSSSDTSGGIAATPKAVSDSKILKDLTIGTQYKLVVDNGVLYVENISTGTRKTLLSGIT